MKKIVISIETTEKNQIIDITELISDLVKDLDDQIILVSIPYTTAGITVNENYDPAVKSDLIFSFNIISPNYKEFRHEEGNSDAHVKRSLVSRSEQFVVLDKKLDLGKWEGIYFCEFHGPRHREIWIYV